MVFSKLFGDPIKNYLTSLQPIVAKVNALEPELEKLSDEQLRAQLPGLKARLAKGESLDDILPEAFALVREAAKRTLGQRHFDAQIIGGIVLHQGKIAEMATGEGKTLTATLPLFLNALEGKGCHLVTVNDYLAKRDTVWMGQIYQALGLKVGCIVHDSAFLYAPSYEQEKLQTPSSLSKARPSYSGELKTNSKIQNPKDQKDIERDTLGAFKVVEAYLRPVTRKEAYQADITYGTNNEFGFDYLRDNMVYDLSQQVQPGHNYAIVDEVDSILIDEARTPLIISQPDVEAAGLYREFARLMPRLQEGADYNVDEKLKAVTLTEPGIAKIEKIVGLENIYEQKGMRYLHYLEQALRAKVLFHKDKDYVVKNGEVIIVDEFTGRLLSGRRYSEGLHQAIEAKEGLTVQPESKTLATITFQNYFRKYKKLAGMTGTALTSAEEFDKVYRLEVVPAPTHRPMIRQNLPDQIYKTWQAKFNAVVKEVSQRHNADQPVLIGTTSIEKNEYLSKLLARAGISHQILNAKNHEREGAIIAQAGKLGAVTCATNMAGRGVDIILGGNPLDPSEAEKVRQLGGLCVIGTERHEARRIDNQLRGRSGRQGDPGRSQFFVSLDDDVVRIFGGDRIKGLLERFNFPEEQAIEHPMITKAIQEAQAKIEGANFDIRKHLLEYDEVLNKHREVIYKKRRELLEQPLSQDDFLQLFQNEIQNLIALHCAGNYPSEWNIEELAEELKSIIPLAGEVHPRIIEISQRSGSAPTLQAELLSWTVELWKSAWQKRAQELGQDKLAQIQKILPLQLLDIFWTDHLTMMDHLRDSVRLQAYGQRDPLVEYKREGHRLFKNLLTIWQGQLVRNIMKVQLQPVREMRPTPTPIASSVGSEGGFARKKIGRNDPCPCGAKHPDGRPMKYKHCHGK